MRLGFGRDRELFILCVLGDFDLEPVGGPLDRHFAGAKAVVGEGVVPSYPASSILVYLN